MFLWPGCGSHIGAEAGRPSGDSQSHQRCMEPCKRPWAGLPCGTDHVQTSGASAPFRLSLLPPFLRGRGRGLASRPGWPEKLVLVQAHAALKGQKQLGKHVESPHAQLGRGRESLFGKHRLETEGWLLLRAPRPLAASGTSQGARKAFLQTDVEVRSYLGDAVSGGPEGSGHKTGRVLSAVIRTDRGRHASPHTPTREQADGEAAAPGSLLPLE